MMLYQSEAVNISLTFFLMFLDMCLYKMYNNKNIIYFRKSK